MPTPDRPEPRFAVSVNEHLLEADLAHATAAGRAAIAPVIDELEEHRHPQVPAETLPARRQRRHPTRRLRQDLHPAPRRSLGRRPHRRQDRHRPNARAPGRRSAPSGGAVDTQRLPGRPQTTAGDRRAGPAGQEPRRSQLNDHGWAARLSHTPRAGERFRAKFWRRCPGNVGDLLRGREVLGPNRAFRRRGWLSWSACSIWSDLSTRGAGSSSGTGMGRRGRDRAARTVIEN